MGVVFDEVVADIRPDREETPVESQAMMEKKGPDIDAVTVALARRRRLDARLDAH
jgi:hypothetical protein